MIELKNSKLRQGDLVTVLAELYDSEINVSISCLWDGGWDLKVGGSEVAGFKVEGSLDRDATGYIGQWLAEQAAALYPESQFAAAYQAAIDSAP